MKPTLKISTLLWVLMLLMWQVTHALPPLAPRLELDRSGFQITLRWDDTAAAEGYRLYYAPYPALGNLASLDLAKQHELTVTLWNGAAFYVWLSAYNAEGESQPSNIEHFVIDNKVVAFLPGDALGQANFANSSGGLLQAGLQEAFSGATGARLEVVFVNSNDTQRLKDLLFGTGTQLGYASDPNVIAVVTSTTAQTLALASKPLDSPLLVISCKGTASILKALPNVLTLAPDNAVQAGMIYQKLTALAQFQQRHIKYAVLLDNEPGITLYSHDLYIHLLQHSLTTETALQDQAGLDAAGNPVAFAQLVGTFLYDGGAAQMDAALSQMDIVQPDVVLHLGFNWNFKTLTDKRPGLLWVGSDMAYDYADYQGKNVAVVSLHGGTRDYGYDAGGFLKAVLDSVSGSLVSRQGVLDAAQFIVYQGRTGYKGFTPGVVGTYDLLVPGPSGWVNLAN